MRALWKALLVAALGVMPSAALPAGWVVSAEGSALAFDYRLDGDVKTGQFLGFSGSGELDPEEPEAAKLELRIRTDSIDLGNRLVSAYATSSEWFDSAGHPVAVYRLDRLEPLGENRWQARGRLELKGQSKVLDTVLTMEAREGMVRASGTIEIDRRAFDLGLEITDLVVDVGNLVTVRFDLVGRRM